MRPSRTATTITVLKKALERGKIDRSEKIGALKRLGTIEEGGL